MLNGAGLFFILALVAYFLGATGIAGISLLVGKTFLVFFLVLSAVSFSETLARKPGPSNPH